MSAPEQVFIAVAGSYFIGWLGHACLIPLWRDFRRWQVRQHGFLPYPVTLAPREFLADLWLWWTDEFLAHFTP